MTDKKIIGTKNTGKQTTNIMWRAMGVKVCNTKSPDPDQNIAKKIKEKRNSTGMYPNSIPEDSKTSSL